MVKAPARSQPAALPVLAHRRLPRILSCSCFLLCDIASLPPSHPTTLSSLSPVLPPSLPPSVPLCPPSLTPLCLRLPLSSSLPPSNHGCSIPGLLLVLPQALLAPLLLALLLLAAPLPHTPLLTAHHPGERTENTLCLRTQTAGKAFAFSKSPAVPRDGPHTWISRSAMATMQMYHKCITVARVHRDG